MNALLQFLLAHWHIAISLIVGLYELVVRLMPTVGNYSLLKIIVDLLKWLSDHLNVTKK
jgi:hypothetical protein